MFTVLTEARHAVRRLRRSPGFTLTAVVSLSLGIGAASTVFGVVNGLFLRPLPGIVEAEGIVRVAGAPASFANFRDVRSSTSSLSHVAAFRDQLMSFVADGDPEQVLGKAVSGEYFGLLGTVPAAGRLIVPADESEAGDLVAVLSHRLWRTRFGSDPEIIGRTVRLNGSTVTVAGVAQEGFVGVFRGFQFDVWVPIRPGADRITGLDTEARGTGQVQLLGRLRDGSRRAAAASEIAGIGARLRQEHPRNNEGLELSIEPYIGFDPALRRGAMALVSVLAAVAGLVVLIACVNLANMLMARSASRAREVAVRSALGGRRAAITALVVWETFLLVCLSVVGGLALGEWASRALRELVAGFPVPLALDVGVDGRVVALTLPVALLAGLAAAIVPAAQASRTDVAQALKGAGRTVRRGSRLGRGFVIGQVALAATLLVSAGLFVRTLSFATARDPGFAVEEVQVAPFLDLGPLGLDGEDAIPLFERIREGVAGLPGVRSASLVANVPLSFVGASTAEVMVEGLRPAPGQEGIEVDFTTVAPDYFATMRIALRSGRDFDSRDAPSAPAVAIVNETLAERFWPDEDAVGRTVRHGGRALRVVGVAADSRSRALDDAARPFLYVPHTQNPVPRLNVVILPLPATGDPGPAVRRVFHEIEPSLAPPHVQPLTDFLALSLLPQRTAAAAGGVLGVAGLLLAALGVFGVVSLTVSRRFREIGIRLALGSTRRRVVRLVLREGVVLALAGLVVGLPLAFAGSGLLSGLLFGVSRADPITYLAVAAILVGAAAIGSGWPAWRATRADPMVALRGE